jgi:hypothetical protein
LIATVLRPLWLGKGKEKVRTGIRLVLRPDSPIMSLDHAPDTRSADSVPFVLLCGMQTLKMPKISDFKQLARAKNGIQHQ